MRIHIFVDGLEAVGKTLEELPQKTASTALLKMSQFIYDKALSNADAHTKTGELIDSIFNEGDTGDPFVRTVGFNTSMAPHAVFVHWGTRPHKIMPVNKKALRWTNGGGFIFAKFVNHPGYAGDPFLVNAMNEAVLNFDKIINQPNREP